MEVILPLHFGSFSPLKNLGVGSPQNQMVSYFLWYLWYLANRTGRNDQLSFHIKNDKQGWVHLNIISQFSPVPVSPTNPLDVFIEARRHMLPPCKKQLGAGESAGQSKQMGLTYHG